MKFKLLIIIEIAINNGILRLKSTKPVIYPANKCSMPTICWHFNIYEQNKFHAQLSCEHEKSFITSGPDIIWSVLGD